MIQYALPAGRDEDQGYAPARRGALPAQLDTFIGRERELAHLADRLAAVRLVSLVGPAGSGKTRLAVELATRVGLAYHDGVRYVGLASVDRAHPVASLVAAELGVPVRPGEPPVEALVAALADRDMLLVVDNCEHLLDGCAALVEALLQGCPGLRVLTTSRERLRICGEMVLPVAGLAFPTAGDDPPAASPWDFDAVRLFMERARERCGGHALPEAAESGSVVSAICARLDGLPLAIELATWQLDLLGLHGLLAALDDRFSTLTVGSRTAANRQTSLRAAIDWSYDLLSPRDQMVFRRLSVLTGCFDLDDAVAACAAEQLPAAEVTAALGKLIECSLVVRVPQAQPGQAPRFRQLESIRVYGLDRLARAGSVPDAAGASVPDTAGGSLIHTAGGSLTQREAEVASLIAEGLTNQQVATRLGVSQRTVEAHLEHIRKKLGLRSRVQVALWFTESNRRKLPLSTAAAA